jgi:hypothetical protein
MAVAGKWNITMDTPIGTQKFTWDLADAGGAWTGTMNSLGGATRLSPIKVDGDNVSFETDVQGPMGQLHLTFLGAVAGDKISGTCKTMFGDQSFAGTRA